MARVFVVMPLWPESKAVYDTILGAAAAAGRQRGEQMDVSGPVNLSAQRGLVINAVYDSLAQADLIVADITLSRPNAMYELGYADALQKPTIIISERRDDIPFDVAYRRTILYERSRLTLLHEQLVESLVQARENPEHFRNTYDPARDPNARRPTAFISYSHADRDYLQRLLVHLKPLERAKLVDVWVDTRIKAGDKWEDRIREALNEAAIAVLLISADFLASDFIVNNELPPLLMHAEARGTRILPLILKPCRFQRDQNLNRFQAVNPPSEPLLRLNEIDREELYSKVAEAIEIEINSKTRP